MFVIRTSLWAVTICSKWSAVQCQDTPTLMKSTFCDPLDLLVGSAKQSLRCQEVTYSASQVWEGCMIQGKGSEDISVKMRAGYLDNPSPDNPERSWDCSACMASKWVFFFNQVGKDRRQGNGEDSGRDFASWAKNVRRWRAIEDALKVRKEYKEDGARKTEWGRQSEEDGVRKTHLE